MVKQGLLILCSTLLLVITGCGGGNSSSSSPQDTERQTSETPNKKGKLLGLQGFHYTAGNSAKGITTQDGQFEYLEGDSISFFLGDILLGTTTADDYITLENIAGSHPDAEDNLRRFLATVDFDLSPMNGILVNNQIHSAAEGYSLNFNQSSADFKIEAESILQTSLTGLEHSVALQHSLVTLLPNVEEYQTQLRARELPSFSYPTTTFNAELADEANAVFELMLQNTIKPGDSPLEFIFKATNTKLVLQSDDPEILSLTNLYAEYKQRVIEIGKEAAYITREELVNKPSEPTNAVSAHHLLVMSDFQMRDEESPLNLAPTKFLLAASYYPASSHVPYQVDAMIRTVRQYEVDINKPIDMAIFTGDLLDIGSFNEARWGIDILDGGNINPDSGADDDPIPGNFIDGKPNDSYDAFTAIGLNGQTPDQADIPWYYVAGNHDGLVLGTLPITDTELKLFGKTIRIGTRPFFDNIATGSTNWLGYEPSVIGFLEHLFSPASFVITADEDRRTLRSNEIALQMSISKDPNFVSQPIGHGMKLVLEQQGELKDGQLNYSFSSNDDLIKHIALDSSMAIGHLGFLTQQDISWIKQQLQDAQDSGQLVIVSSHHKPDDILFNSKTLVDTLNQYPNVIAHLVAHSHENRILPRLGETPELGYWEIESGSMVNWPQQFRVLDISIDSNSGIGTIKSTMLNHDSSSPLDVSQRGRFLSYVERYLERYSALDISDPTEALAATEGYPEDRNTFLFFKVPANVLARL